MTAKQGVNKDGVNTGVNTKTRCGHWCGQQNDSAKHYSAVNYAAKTGFLVRKEMVRSEVRSESMKMDRGGDDNFTLLGEAVARVQGKASFTICGWDITP